MKNINHRKLITALLVLVCSIGAVVLLQYFSIQNRGYVGGGFQRNFVSAPLLSFKSKDLKFNSFYVAGVSDTKIYLGSQTAPITVVAFNMSLTDSSVVKITFDQESPVLTGPVRVNVDSPRVYVFNGIAPYVYIGNVSTFKTVRLPGESVYFKDIVPVDEASFILRAKSTASGLDEIFKVADTLSAPQGHPTFLEKQIDGIFCTDGMLHYSKSLSSVVYVYYYRNQYIVSDPTFKSIFRWRTIDTTSRARIRIADIESSKTRTLAAPPVTVNRKSSVSGDWLYIQSGLLADNQSPSDLKHYEVIDAYNLAEHRYKYSFYLPFERGQRLTSLKVSGDRLVVVYGQYLFVYHISPTLLKTEMSLP